MIVARGEDEAAKTVDEIAPGGTAEMTTCDVSDWDQVQAMVASTAKVFGGLDILCANAGIFPQTKMVDMDPTEWDHVMATNLRTSFLCVKACIRNSKRPDADAWW